MDFNKEIKKLNPEQRRAVEFIEGPVMVVAGPGTGKTQVLTLRIANILKRTDTPEQSILALTFTESAAASMQGRLFELIGPQAYRVSIKTIHGFCNEVIQNYPEEFLRISGANSITEVDQIRLVRRLLDSEDYPLLRPFGDPYRNAGKILSAIGEIKREGVDPEQFMKIVKREQEYFENIDDLYHEKGARKGKMKGKYQAAQKKIEKQKELARLYGAYQNLLAKARQYDYDDMVLEVARELSANSSLLFALQERYLYILVDEHQDTNSAQNKVIELLASFHESPNLFVVGDEKQAIYRFQGASVENFNYFKKRFKGARVVHLEHNYRSTQTILDAALDVALGKGPLKAKAGHKKTPIALAEFSSPDAEHYFVASEVKKKLSEGVKPEEIAVLYRLNSDSEPIGRMLEKLGVKFFVRFEGDILDDYEIKKLLSFFAAVRDFGADHAFVPCLYVDFIGVWPLDVALLLEAARKQKSSVFSLARDPKTLKRIIPESAAKVFSLYQNLSRWAVMAKNQSPLAVFEAIVYESGLLSFLSNDSQGDAKLAKMHALFDQMKAMLQANKSAKFEDFLSYLDILREHKVGIKAQVAVDRTDAVQLMTAHRAKGLEFEHVYIVGATLGRWGSRRNREVVPLPKAIYTSAPPSILDDKDEKDFDERNLFYVALTRAKKQAIISYSKKNAEGKDQLISEFAAQIRTELIKKLNTEPWERAWQKNRDIELRPSLSARQAPLKEKRWIQKRFLEKGLSASSLNNYLECPNKFYLLSLVGAPQAPNRFLQFGNAAHAALAWFTKELNKGKKVNKKQLLKYFERSLAREPIAQKDFKDIKEKGAKVLSAYFDAKGSSWPKASLAEYGVEAGYEITSSKGNTSIKLKGWIDRIDLSESGFASVVDYKTGRVHARHSYAKALKGEKSSSMDVVKAGNNYRQLVFYKLLLERGTKMKVREAMLDFIEDPKKGVMVFAPSEKEVAELEKVIGRVADEVMSLKFWGKKCANKDCKYCELRGF